jgi:hypothetical protein
MKTMLHIMHLLITVSMLPSDGMQIFHPTGRYAVAQPAEVQQVKVKKRTRYIVSESWCRNCPARKALFIKNGWPAENVLTIAQCKHRFGFTVPHVPYEFEWDVSSESTYPENVSIPQAKINRSPPSRYIQWSGWGTIDLETYNRNCNCGMCRSIRAKQAEYRRQMQAYQSSLPDDQQPCPIALIEQMLDLMQLRSDDVLADLGCEDGRILIAAARRGIRGIGVELDHTRVSVARQAINDSGLSHLITVEQGDARNFDASRATVITAYLYPTLLAELSSKLRSVRVAASPFHQVEGLNMVQHGDVWLYRRGGA